MTIIGLLRLPKYIFYYSFFSLICRIYINYIPHCQPPRFSSIPTLPPSIIPCLSLIFPPTSFPTGLGIQPPHPIVSYLFPPCRLVSSPAYPVALPLPPVKGVACEDGRQPLFTLKGGPGRDKIIYFLAYPEVPPVGGKRRLQRFNILCRLLPL